MAYCHENAISDFKGIPDNGERLFEILRSGYSINKKEKVKEYELQGL